MRNKDPESDGVASDDNQKGIEGEIRGLLYTRQARRLIASSPFDKQLGRELIGPDKQQVQRRGIVFTARTQDGLAALAEGPWATDLIPETGRG